MARTSTSERWKLGGGRPGIQYRAEIFNVDAVGVWRVYENIEFIIALIRINRICLVIVLLEENRVDKDGSSEGTLAQQHTWLGTFCSLNLWPLSAGNFFELLRAQFIAIWNLLESKHIYLLAIV
ncbi:hypothetical protein WN943_007948 [Citrus x changshan-huyou]